MERGITPITRELRQQLAQALSCPEDALKPGVLPVTGAQSSRNIGATVHMVKAGWIHVPIYGALAAGAPGYTMSDVIETELMPEWAGDFERWGRIITGASMEDEFEDGDIAIFENRRAEDGHGVHAFAEGEETFKIYRDMGDGSSELWPTNPAYLPFSAQGYEIRGVCIRRIRKGAHGIRDIREYPHGYRVRHFKSHSSKD
jgi:hypothetical protein